MRKTLCLQQDIFVAQCISALETSLPPIFARRAIPKYFGEAIALGTIANLGKDGPPYVQQGRNAIYEKRTFLEWFQLYLEGGVKGARKIQCDEEQCTQKQ